MNKLILDGHSLTLSDVEKIANDTSAKTKVFLSESCKKTIQESFQFIESKIQSDEAIYGVSTGFGVLSNVKISQDKLEKLQLNLIRSHATGVGPNLSEQEVRAIILLRANTLAQGNSGVSVELVEALLNLLNYGIHPLIPEQGSVGASGDLAPLAHLALGLIGEGKVFYKGKIINSSDALKFAGLKPYKLKPKEGLSLINGTQVMTAIGALSLQKAKKVLSYANIAAAMSLEAIMGSASPFKKEVHDLRPHSGQKEIANIMRSLLKDSEIMKSHAQCNRIQDPYSFRCIPQVHGASLDLLKYVEKILAVEINSVTDNPLVIFNNNKYEIVNAGNFHGQYIASAMDILCMAISEIASISEQRIQKLINPAFSELPAFLIDDGGLNSGFMIAHVTAASLVSENKTLSHPASIDSIPTSTDKEDHVSMGTIAARKARSVVQNTWNVIAIEFLVSAQGLDYRKPKKPAKALIPIYNKIRKHIPFAKEDRVFSEDIKKISELMQTGEILK
jgi:histidine ammonia-lyase